MIPLTKPVHRALNMVWRRLDLVVRVAPEGVYLKGRGQRWSSAVFVPWAAAFDVGAKMKAQALAEAKRKKREERRAALGLAPTRRTVRRRRVA